MRWTITTVLLASFAGPAAGQELLWTRQIGTSEWDLGKAVAMDGAGNTYITGYTEGSLGGLNAGDRDAFLAKHDASGVLLWTRQAGTPAADYGQDVAVDSAGNAYITGPTEGNLGGPNTGGWDTFLAKYDTAGIPLWTRQLGTTTSVWGNSLAVDSAGNAYITGLTGGSLGGPNAGSNDVFLAKYDASGALLWTRQAGTTAGDGGNGVAVDSAGNVYITGGTVGSLGGPNAGRTDVFLAKYDASGALLWTRQAGTSEREYATGVGVDDAGSAYITGYTRGSLGGPNVGGSDVFLTKFNGAGVQLWMRQIGTSIDDRSFDIAVDGVGNAYISGDTQGSLGGPSAGLNDAFLAKYDASGALLWTRQAGSSGNDISEGVAVDSAGNGFITGWTDGSLGGPSAGGFDAFLIKYEAFCYADCDQSTSPGILDVFDFLCWQNDFVAGNSYACDCDTTTGPLVCDVFDFLCFQNAFVGGCP